MHYYNLNPIYIDPIVYGNAAFGQAALPILLDDLACSGSESQLLSCSFDSVTTDCSHSQDAGVKCQHGKHVQTVVHFCRYITLVQGQTCVCGWHTQSYSKNNVVCKFRRYVALS